MFTGSISENRVTIALSPVVRQELFAVARAYGVKVPEYIRHLLMNWYAQRQADADPKQNGKTDG